MFKFDGVNFNGDGGPGGYATGNGFLITHQHTRPPNSTNPLMQTALRHPRHVARGNTL